MHRNAPKGKLYAYADLFITTGSPTINPLTTFQYGVADNLALGLKFNGDYMRFVARSGFTINEHLGIGAEFDPIFDLTNDFKYSGFVACLAADGAIYKELFYCVNTWFSVNSSTEIEQQFYLGYNFPLSSDWTFSPMVGTTFLLNKKSEINPVIGLSFAHKNWSYLIWTSHYFGNPTIELCIDVLL